MMLRGTGSIEVRAEDGDWGLLKAHSELVNIQIMSNGWYFVFRIAH